MPTTKTPQQTLEDSKVASLLDDMLDDILDADQWADGLSRGRAYRALTSTVRGTFDDAWDEALAASQAVEKERDYVLAGKARDLRKMKTLVTAALEGLENLNDAAGRLQALEDAALEAQIVSWATVVAEFTGPLGDLKVCQARLAGLYKSLQKANIAARDAKVKSMVGAACGAAGVCLASFGTVVVVLGGVTLFVAENVISAALQGNEESGIKKSWNLISGAANGYDALVGMPDAFGPVMVLVTGGVDIAECFANEAECARLLQEIEALKREFDSLLPRCAKQLQAAEKTGAEAKKKLTSAIAAVNSFRPTRGRYYSLAGLL